MLGSKSTAGHTIIQTLPHSYEDSSRTEISFHGLFSLLKISNELALAMCSPVAQDQFIGSLKYFTKNPGSIYYTCIYIHAYIYIYIIFFSLVLVVLSIVSV